MIVKNCKTCVNFCNSSVYAIFMIKNDIFHSQAQKGFNYDQIF